MDRQEIIESYTVRDGEIADPGKFEGEPIYAPFLYGFYAEGWDDEATVEGTLYVGVQLTADDRMGFPELADVWGAILHESDQGFFHCETFENEAEYKAAWGELEKLEALEALDGEDA